MSNIQTFVNDAGKLIGEAYQNRKDALASLKGLKLAVKEKLLNSEKFLDLKNRSKEIKRVRKKMLENLKDINKEIEQMAQEMEEQKEIEDFVDEQDQKFYKVKDSAIANLSQQLKDEGLIAEIQFKSGQLSLIVIRL